MRITYHLLGLGCLILSLFFPTIPQQMTLSHEQVEVWESPLHTHTILALGPLGFALDLIDITLDPDEYGAHEAGDGYEQLIKERTLQFFCSIPISISWFMVWGTLFFTKTRARPLSNACAWVASPCCSRPSFFPAITIRRQRFTKATLTSASAPT